MIAAQSNHPAKNSFVPLNNSETESLEKQQVVQ